ncbi:hypothetical protein PDIDSM_3488 [Penicillium digitatum]|nr:hypothetical protein PDIDSM_3488 [Penicillium digitatum]
MTLPVDIASTARRTIRTCVPTPTCTGVYYRYWETTPPTQHQTYVTYHYFEDPGINQLLTLRPQNTPPLLGPPQTKTAVAPASSNAFSLSVNNTSVLSPRDPEPRLPSPKQQPTPRPHPLTAARQSRPNLRDDSSRRLAR